ncbi:uncharacterized protein SOCEGT47_078050 [Sorangium cellulosum]|uniref:Uncharacterized protein n=1 Tax=Sorangium cellulosum TaxID=56 RepID=A0A4V0NES8_SORCE|nr:hypothetical protein [Sorangium cellulosum]AUX27222.1 uncharacterized protein SOCEGT47_078050 [Sorangium cellulosum]
MSSWEDELREHFPGYLLPSAQRGALTREAAERFLSRLGHRVDLLELLLAASALSPLADEVRAFARELPLVARELPAHTEMQRVENRGRIRGRLDVPGTLRKRAAGDPDGLTSRVRERRFDLPENVLLVATAARLAGLLARLEQSGVIAKNTKKSWAQGFTQDAEAIRHALESTVLREVPRAPVQAAHEQAARAARHPAYRRALRLHDAMKSMATNDAVALARLVAEGALAPMDAPTRFEIAVLIRLGRQIEEALRARGEAVELRRALIEPNRAEVFDFAAGRTQLRVLYNQVCFDDLGPRDRGMRHYFGNHGRFRPDITLELVRDGRRLRAVVVEVKLSDERDYLGQGYHEALLYRAEYEKDLTGWPKAILVVSSAAIQGAPRREDDVIAVSWDGWVPQEVLDGLLDGFSGAHPPDSERPNR